MAESSNPTSQTERSARLAERFGMTRADIEHLLTQTHSEYSGGAPTAPLAPIEQAKNPVSNAEEPGNRSEASGPQPLGGASLAIIFAILLVGLVIAFSLKQGYFEQRHDRQAAADSRARAKLADTTKSAEEQSAAPIPPTTVPPGELPPESQVGIANRVAHHTPSHVPHQAAPHPALQTSSEFEAEETLADLRAEGNTKAHVKSIRKHGTMSYQVFSK